MGQITPQISLRPDGDPPWKTEIRYSVASCAFLRLPATIRPVHCLEPASASLGVNGGRFYSFAAALRAEFGRLIRFYRKCRTIGVIQDQKLSVGPSLLPPAIHGS